MITPKVSNSCYLQVNPTWHNCLYSRFSSSMVWCSWATNHCMIWPCLIPTRSQWVNRNWVFFMWGQILGSISYQVSRDILMYIHARISIILKWQINQPQYWINQPAQHARSGSAPARNGKWPIPTRLWHWPSPSRNSWVNRPARLARSGSASACWQQRVADTDPTLALRTCNSTVVNIVKIPPGSK